jgi:hypothetical protein
MLYRLWLPQSRGRTGEDVAKLRVAVCEMATAGPFAAARLRRSVLASRGRLRFRLLVGESEARRKVFALRRPCAINLTGRIAVVKKFFAVAEIQLACDLACLAPLENLAQSGKNSK